MPQAGSGEVLALGDCTLDAERGLLLRGGVPVPLRPKTFALLLHFAANAGRVVGKSELLDAVWPDVTVTEDSLTQSVRDLRKALGDAEQTLIRTVAKRGYVLSIADDAPGQPTGQPTVAVLRFLRDGVGADQALIDGFTEDLVNGLARFRSVTVRARSSSFEFSSDSNEDVQAIGRRLATAYIVRGRISFNADLLRISVALVDAQNGSVLWSEKFSGSGAEVFHVQEEIALKIVSRLVSRIDAASLARAATKLPASLEAYELLLRGVARLRGYGPDDNGAARTLFREAIAKDPDYGLANSYLALTEIIMGGYAAATDDVVSAAVDRAARGHALAPEEPRCHRILGLVRLFARQHEAAEHHMRTSFQLNPYDPETMAQIGYTLTMRGRPIDALQWMDRAIQSNPMHLEYYHPDRAMALYALGEYEATLASLQKLPRLLPQWLTRMAASHAQLGDMAAARASVGKLNKLFPNFSPLKHARSGTAFEHQADIDHLVEGIEKALAA